GFDVALAAGGAAHQVARRVLLARGASVGPRRVVDGGRVVGERGDRVEDGGQLLVLDLDERGSLFGGVAVVGGDGGDHLAGEAHLVHGEDGHVAHGAAEADGGHVGA